MKTINFTIIILILAFLQYEANAQEMDLATFTSTLPNLEPADYSYDFFAPVYSELLCKFNKQKTALAADITNPAESDVYEGNPVSFAGAVNSDKNVHFLSNSFVELTPGFIAAAGSVFSANVEDGCPTVADYIANSEPSLSNRYFMSVFAPRMKVKKYSNGDREISETFDFHQGADIVDKKIPKESEGDTLSYIHCACDGIVVDIFDEEDVPDLEKTGRGRSVTVMCDTHFAGTEWDSIFLAFRHLSEIDSNIMVGAIVSKGEVIGKMGQSGITTNNHLHFSVQRRECRDSYPNCDLTIDSQVYEINVHPMRAFNPNYNPHLVKELDDSKAEVHLLAFNNGVDSLNTCDSLNFEQETEGNWALVRVAIPYSQVSMRAITIKVGSTAYSRTYDFEQISEHKTKPPAGDDTLNFNLSVTPEDYDYVKDLQLYVFPFNRASSPRWFYTTYKPHIDTLSSFHTGQCGEFEIPNSGVFKTETYVLDILTNNIPGNFDPEDIVVEVVDIWGNGIRAQLPGNSSRPSIPSHTTIHEAQPSLTLYPNPTQDDIVNLKFQGLETAGTANITLYNSLGQLQRQQVLQLEDSPHHQMNFSDLPTGLYFIRAEVSGQVLTQQLVVQRK